MEPNVFSLDGSVALVTGASRGIGEAIAVAMAEAGADVAVLARSTDDLNDTADRIRNAGANALVVTADVTEEDQVIVAFEQTVAKLGPVDVLVNNAGTNPYFGSTEDLDIDTWERILAVNTTGAFHCAREFGRRIFERDLDGAVINIGSVGSLVGLPYQAPYTTSKHALAGLTRALAIEWASSIRVNALAPGYVKTEFTKGVRENQSIQEELLNDIPQDRFAEPEAIAPAAVYLASDAAKYVTGEIHVVDGGMTAK
jgi:NAD(P)-dependent dehydrogenase (short-subunit alcohol dehydrogenase family)